MSNEEQGGQQDGRQLILIYGSACSGKSTLANTLQDFFEKSGKTCDIHDEWSGSLGEGEFENHGQQVEIYVTNCYVTLADLHVYRVFFNSIINLSTPIKKPDVRMLAVSKGTIVP